MSSVTVTFNHFPELAKLIEQQADKLLDEYAVKAREDAQRNMPRKTGSAADGLYVVTPLRNEYGQAASRAKSDNPHVEIVDQVPTPKDHSVALSGAAGHTIDVELGTVNMPARPSLVPALEAQRAALIEALSKILS